MDREAVAKELAKDLDRKHVKPPPPGKYGEYIEGWHAIAEANRIFGWDGWSYEIEVLDQTNCDQRGDKWAVGYMARVRVWIPESHDAEHAVQAVYKEDIGHGQGHSKSLGDAHESAMKEAVTDALKRALRTFGHPFGLALYDKTKAHVSDDPNAAERAEEDEAREIAKMQTITDIDELGSYWRVLKEAQPHIARRPNVIAAKDDRKAVIGGKEAE